jgi:hypothetical protein
MNHELKELESFFSKLKFRKWKNSQPRKSSDLLMKDHEGNYAVAYYTNRDFPLYFFGNIPFGFPVYWAYLNFYEEQGWGVPGFELTGTTFTFHDLRDNEEITFSDTNFDFR